MSSQKNILDVLGNILKGKNKNLNIDDLLKTYLKYNQKQSTGSFTPSTFPSTNVPPGAGPSVYSTPKGIKVSDLENSFDKNSMEYIRNISVQLLDQINKGNIMDKDDLLNFISRNSGVQFSNILDMLFYYYWFGGEKCRRSVDSKCSKSIQDFLYLSRSYPNSFFPFIYIQQPNRKENIVKWMTTRPNYFLITLSSKTPHAFSVYYNLNGKVFGSLIDGTQDIPRTVDYYVSEFNKNFTKKATPPQQSDRATPSTEQKQKSELEKLVEMIKPNILDGMINIVDPRTSWKEASASTKEYIDYIEQLDKKVSSNNKTTKFYQWLGANCEKASKICKQNLFKFDEIGQIYGSKFLPFESSENIVNLLQKSQDPYIITLSKTPGMYYYINYDKNNNKIDGQNLSYDDLGGKNIYDQSTTQLKYPPVKDQINCIDMSTENSIADLIQRGQNANTNAEKQNIKKEINKLLLKIYPDKVGNDKNYKSRCEELNNILIDLKKLIS